MVGVFSSEKRAYKTVSTFSVLTLLVTLLLVVFMYKGRAVAFSDMFVVDGFGVFMKVLVIVGSAVTLIMSDRYLRREDMTRFEYPILVLFATLGMMMMISANDLISLYVGLELQSLSLYVIAAFQRDSIRSTEAGLKYFVLGALSSGMLLYGCSMIYGFAGTTSFPTLAKELVDLGQAPIGLIVGLVFLIAGLAFKVSAVPFHMWTPDVYEGAPTSVTAFFAVAPKIAAIALFLRVMLGPFEPLLDEWRQIIVFISILSMVLGAFAAINQTNIKRLMAYSSIGHIGYALIGLAAGGLEGVTAVLVYMAIYLIMNMGAFGCILSMRHKDGAVEGISDLAGLAKTNPQMALALMIFMFSMAGIPPLAGFFGKLYIFMAAIEAGLIALAVIGVVSSVVAAFYYVRIVKVMYFDEPAEAFERPVGKGITAVISVTAVITALFFIGLAPVVDIATAAAGTLLVR
ncbi:MAG: NADH-quinone oxidoreductase subunit NuoN, partial [Alphaproteobacteria bacterium]|nr:NADH-quinone oxidoreductase subunit NuoN [Alphaproteobacteria bacterium]